jgi:hypothetical protein
LIEKLRKRCPHIDADINKALAAIESDGNACQGRPMVRFGGTVIKYRLKCTDQNRGSRGGFRIIAFYDQTSNTIYPISIYLKSDIEDLPDEDVRGCVNELQEALKATT